MGTTNILRQQSVFRPMLVLVLIFVPLFIFTQQLFKNRQNINHSVDFFDMSLEELMTVEIAAAQEPDAAPSEFL